MTQVVDKVENVEVDGVTYATSSLNAQQKALVSLYEDAFTRQKQAERDAYVFSRGAQRIADELVGSIRDSVAANAAASAASSLGENGQPAPETDSASTD